MHQSGKTYVYELNGLGRRMPVTFGCLTVASLSLIGIPLFAGFISKWNIAQAAFAYGGETVTAGNPMGFMAFAAVAVLLYSAFMTAIYMLTVLIRAYFPKEGSVADGLETVKDPGWMMLAPLLVFAVIIIVLGLNSGPLMELLRTIGGAAG